MRVAVLRLQTGKKVLQLLLEEKCSVLFKDVLEKGHWLSPAWVVYIPQVAHTYYELSLTEVDWFLWN